MSWNRLILYIQSVVEFSYINLLFEIILVSIFLIIILFFILKCFIYCNFFLWLPTCVTLWSSSKFELYLFILENLTISLILIVLVLVFIVILIIILLVAYYLLSFCLLLRLFPSIFDRIYNLIFEIEKTIPTELIWITVVCLFIVTVLQTKKENQEEPSEK